MRKILFLVVLIACLFSVKSYSWGKKGHALVAEIAFKYLDKNTKKLVKKYLDGMSIQDAANWMDEIKKNKSLDNLKPLHYVNFEKNEQIQVRCCDNILSALNECITNLKNHKNLTSVEIKSNLFYLFHLIGDLHQPLHIGYGSDKGGNKYQVNYNGNPTNLHSLYDTGIITSKNIKLKQCLNERVYTNEELLSIQNIDIIKWSTDSRSYLDTIYNIENRKISKEYVIRNVPIIKSQLHLAGIRLAGILQTVFVE